MKRAWHPQGPRHPAPPPRATTCGVSAPPPGDGTVDERVGHGAGLGVDGPLWVPGVEVSEKCQGQRGPLWVPGLTATIGMLFAVSSIHLVTIVAFKDIMPPEQYCTIGGGSYAIFGLHLLFSS